MSSDLKVSMQKRDLIMKWLSTPTRATPEKVSKPQKEVVMKTKVISNTKKQDSVSVDIEDIKRKLRLKNELKLKKKCKNLHISAEGNKTVMINRIIHKLYPDQA